MNTSPFMTIVREAIRSRQMALATERTYCYWIKFFIRQQGYTSVTEINGQGVTRFLSYLAVSKRVSPNTQNQAFSALLFLFRHVLQLPLENIDAVRAKETRRIPVVLAVHEVSAILAFLSLHPLKQ